MGCIIIFLAIKVFFLYLLYRAVIAIIREIKKK